MPWRQGGVDLEKLGISGIRECAVRLLGLDGRLGGRLLGGLPREDWPELLRRQSDGPGHTVTLAATSSSVRRLLVGGYPVHNAAESEWLRAAPTMLAVPAQIIPICPGNVIFW